MDWGGVQRLQLQMCKEEKHNSAMHKNPVSDVMMIVVGGAYAGCYLDDDEDVES